MTETNRHEQRRLRTREKLLEAAKRVISERGYHDTTVLDISNAADVSKRTLYVHFEHGKDQILEELARSSVDEIIAAIDAAKSAQVGLPLRQQMTMSLEIVFQWMQDNPRLAAIVHGRDANPQLRANLVDYVAHQIEGQMSHECNFREDAEAPIHLVAQMESAALAQLVTWSLENDHPYTPRDFANFISAVFFGSLTDLYPDEYQGLVE